jgi:MFS family permease
MTGANLAAPLYAVYARTFGFSSLVLTAIFATYAVTLVPTLLLFGRLSDRLGRRPVMLGGLVCAAGGLALFAAADGTAWLFAARVLQGLAVGMIGGPATAALVEFDGHSGGQRPALLAGLAQSGGSGAGPLIAGMLAQWGPDPLRLPYLVMLVVTVLAAGAIFAVPESASSGAPEPWRIQWPRVPREIRGDFARVSLSAAVLWASAALYLSIVPSYAGQLLSTRNLALLGAVSALALAASCVAQVVSKRRNVDPRLAQIGGLCLLVVGLGALIAVSPLHSLAPLIVAAVAGGTGHGIGILGTQDELNGIAPSKRRGEVTAAYITCIYAGVAAAVIATGLIALGAALSTSVASVAAVLAAASLACLVWQLRARVDFGRVEVSRVVLEGARVAIDRVDTLDFAPMAEVNGQPVSGVSAAALAFADNAGVHIIRIAAGGSLPLHTGPQSGFVQVVRGRGTLVLPDGERIRYEAPALFLFAPETLHGWSDVEEDTLMAACLVD